MRLDVESLRTFNRLANTGAERAARSLSLLTGLDTHVDVTRIELSSRADVTREFRDRDRVSVRIGFEGEIDGQTVITIGKEDANRLVEAAAPDASDLGEDDVESGLNELGNIMIGGFIDGWADYLDASIDISTPTYVEVAGEDPLIGVEDRPGDAGVLAFRNQVEATDEAVNFGLFMVPTADSIERLTEAESGDWTVPMGSFSTFSRTISEGAEVASSHISTMTGIDTDVEVCRLNFVPIEGVPTQLGEEVRTGVVLEFEGLPSGYLAILFDEASADSVASALMPGSDGGEEMRKSAIREIGNVVTSGFVDGWANALETTIEISPPTFVNDLAPAIVDPLVADLARNQEHAFLIDSTIRTERDEFTCDIYALPDEAELRTALNRLPPNAA